jgi:hypothetical protein
LVWFGFVFLFADWNCFRFGYGFFKIGIGFGFVICFGFFGLGWGGFFYINLFLLLSAFFF